MNRAFESSIVAPGNLFGSKKENNDGRRKNDAVGSTMHRALFFFLFLFFFAFCRDESQTSQTETLRANTSAQQRKYPSRRAISVLSSRASPFLLFYRVTPFLC